MKIYNAEKLFIGKVGKDNFTFCGQTITIVRDEYWSNAKKDILSKHSYWDADQYSGGDLIYNLTPLSTYINTKSQQTKGVKILERLANKINKIKLITTTEIRDLLFYLNTGKEKEDTKYNTKENKSNLNTNDYCTYLTNKNFKYEPVFGRENEINELFVSLYQNNKGIILVGPDKIGKTSLIEELAHKIQKKEVPDFLKKQKIIELDLLKLFLNNKDVNGTILNIIIKAIKNDEILFIDNIHKIYENNEQMDFILNQSIDRQGLKLIGTTTPDEYNKYFNNNSNYIKLTIQEPSNDNLKDIIIDVFSKYCKNFNIKQTDNINNFASILVKLIQSNNITYTNNLIKENSYDPSLVIEIINRIFIHAQINNQTELNISNIIYAIKTCDKLNDEIKENFINLYPEQEEKQKTLKKGLF